MASNSEQIASLRSKRAALQETAQQLAEALAERDTELQALAKRNGELRWVCRLVAAAARHLCLLPSHMRVGSVRIHPGTSAGLPCPLC